MTTIWERILANCCPESRIDVEAHAARILSVVVAAKKQPKWKKAS